MTELEMSPAPIREALRLPGRGPGRSRPQRAMMVREYPFGEVDENTWAAVRTGPPCWWDAQ